MSKKTKLKKNTKIRELKIKLNVTRRKLKNVRSQRATAIRSLDLQGEQLQEQREIVQATSVILRQCAQVVDCAGYGLEKEPINHLPERIRSAALLGVRSPENKQRLETWEPPVEWPATVNVEAFMAPEKGTVSEHRVPETEQQ